MRLWAVCLLLSRSECFRMTRVTSPMAPSRGGPFGLPMGSPTQPRRSANSQSGRPPSSFLARVHILPPPPLASTVADPLQDLPACVGQTFRD